METRDALDVEIEAYEQMHTQLRNSHFGQYVVVHNGQLIDSDPDFEPLFLRVQTKLGDVPFLVRRVTQTPILEIRAPGSYVWQSPLARRLRAYERKYGMDSEEFNRRFQIGELGDNMDFVEWSIFWDIYQAELGRLPELSKRNA